MGSEKIRVPAKTDARIHFLRNMAVDVRKKVIELTGIAGGGHIGGALSMTEILLVLFFHVMRYRADNPKWSGRDRFVLSKGHGCLGLAPVLWKAGFFDETFMDTFNQLDSPFGMHPDMHRIPGIEMSTGSLGHGFSVACGIALGGKIDNADWRVFSLLGDGECHEGSVWEGAMFASHYKLHNLYAIIDRNGFCIDGPTEKIMSLEPLAKKWRAFGWKVFEVRDGNDVSLLLRVFDDAISGKVDKPTAIICRTVKGKGVSFMENQPQWHYGGLDSEKEREILEALETQRPLMRSDP
jgi:transketolase